MKAGIRVISGEVLGLLVPRALWTDLVLRVSGGDELSMSLLRSEIQLLM